MVDGRTTASSGPHSIAPSSPGRPLLLGEGGIVESGAWLYGPSIGHSPAGDRHLVAESIMNRFINVSKLGGRSLSVLALCAIASAPSWATDQHMMAPRVPMDQIEEARVLTSPLPESTDIIEKGKALYEGKGICVTCHGTTGRGDGPGAAGLDPSPRNFQHHGFWRHRTEGEIFWVIKHGSPGTGMIGFGSMLSD